MLRTATGFGLLILASAAGAETTDFGIRAVGSMPKAPSVGVHPKAEARQAAAVVTAGPSTATWTAIAGGTGNLGGAARIAAQWGRVTSTYRSPAHNRRVGGVPNSLHIHGRAIDIARRPGISHAQIAAAFRNAGYRLIESLDEGDHSHFAFAFGPFSRPPAMAARPERKEVTTWGVVTVASAILR
ncbi:MAG TPA: D-Ala-D-Ala carboxypeptidase family metallohydrolase [Sphingomicrobium sp.]|nr:D-Ala-D-Ala carboxypeptidase family metallohydrolase [Sphingomicrobium sp.]